MIWEGEEVCHGRCFVNQNMIHMSLVGKLSRFNYLVCTVCVYLSLSCTRTNTGWSCFQAEAEGRAESYGCIESKSIRKRTFRYESVCYVPSCMTQSYNFWDKCKYQSTQEVALSSVRIRYSIVNRQIEMNYQINLDGSTFFQIPTLIRTWE